MNPRVEHLLVALALFALVHLAISRLLPRINRTLEAREDATKGTERRAAEVREQAERKRAESAAVLAEARHDAARTRLRAHQEGTALIAAARADAQRERDALLAEAQVRITSDRATAEAELRVYASELASELASRVLGEPVGVQADNRAP
ncbi:ATP synthase F0 subunit B [Streptomyces sp. NPDC046862]|uniref:ATP synthase F0 subunit B n=1 Tax=Streptomyces sp. NPDC046862 TaxID=3154603 RepID=UPI0034531A0A